MPKYCKHCNDKLPRFHVSMYCNVKHKDAYNYYKDKRRSIRLTRKTSEERAAEIKRTAGLLQHILCTRWSKIRYEYEPILVQ